MNIKMATNSQLSTTESKKTKQTTRTGTESQVWFDIIESFGGLSAGSGNRVNGGKGAGIKKHNQQVQNRQGDVKNSIGNREAKELICMTHEHELRGEDCQKEGGTRQKGARGEKLEL